MSTPGVNVQTAEERAKLARPPIKEDDIEAGVAAECVGCGSTKSLAQIRRESPTAQSCCPERAMRAPWADDGRKDEFCARFVAELLRIAGEKDGDGHSVADYAKGVAPTYWDDPDQRADGPEACAQSDHSYWE